ncbi:Uu.00g058910.m01.CDS01 [Anthostomella pinea]|uniref:Uu.00g058910.m01.CDS01 n=1 Tax=Anthostomella pinea TaxID=933095 RepID=A0AAI8YJW9_9PEZI|nr:Uu.00g058910.m01.CDS01 [Anthostomella pinea]
MEQPASPLNIVIVGGSLAGLMCGIALKHAGHTVTILEKDDNERQSHMAGVCLGLDAKVILSRHDRIIQERPTVEFSHKSTRVQALKNDGTCQVYVNGRRDITSWDTFSYYPSPPRPRSTDGTVAYKYQQEVLGLERADDAQMALTFIDGETQQTSRILADFVIGADGPDSLIRSKYLPNVQRRYVGYVAWRGTVPESEISPATRSIFQRSVTVHMMDQQHCVMYTIPGSKGALAPGERLLNFLWYTNETPQDLELIMTGIDGYRHHNIVPAGRVRPDVWNARLDRAKALPLATEFLEVIMKIRQPFIQRITEFCSPSTVFEDEHYLDIRTDYLSARAPIQYLAISPIASDVQEVDVIVAGGGTAGCIVAARLADADPDLSILVIEEGSDNLGNPMISHPAFCYTHVSPGGQTTRFYKGIKEPNVAGREINVPSGAILGGGSATHGWSADDMLYYLKKFETYHGLGQQAHHGYDGPIHISDGRFRATRSTEDFIAAAGQLLWPEIDDLQSIETNNGVQRAMPYVSPHNGIRQDVANRYLRPRLQDGKHPNLYVLIETQVVRVLFDGQRSSGVVCRPNPRVQPENTGSRLIKARKMVVVSCGAFGTPLLLERSGIGKPGILNRADVPLVTDLPGVGEQYQDHHLLLYPYKTNLDPGETLDALAGGRVDPGELMKNNDRILSWNAQDITCKIRPSAADVASLGPDFKTAWDRDFKDVLSRPLVLLALLNVFPGDPTSVSAGQYIAVSTFTVYPYSRGHIHISGPLLEDEPEFASGFFSDVAGLDIKKHVWAYKAQREIIRRMNCYRGEDDANPASPTRPITYTAEDDAVLENWLRENVNTTWHSLGTCRMARAEMGVVDPRLGVYGVSGLKIADMSIAPQNVAANTASTALAIGEKAADLFIQELGLAKH